MASCLADGQLHARLLRSLSDNSLGAEGAAALAPALAANGALTSLNLSSNHLGAKGAAALAPALAANGALTECNLRWNRLGEEGNSSIRNAVQAKAVFELDL